MSHQFLLSFLQYKRKNLIQNNYYKLPTHLFRIKNTKLKQI